MLLVTLGRCIYIGVVDDLLCGNGVVVKYDGRRIRNSVAGVAVGTHVLGVFLKEILVSFKSLLAFLYCIFKKVLVVKIF